MTPARGEVWWAVLDPTRGREQAGRRPVLIVSVDRYNGGGADLVITMPITSRLRGIPYHVTVQPPEGGLTAPSAILCDAVRSIAKERLESHLGTVSQSTMAAIEERIRLLMKV